MKSTILSLFASASASTNAAAFLQITRDGWLTGWHINASSPTVTNGNAYAWELSMTQVFQSGTNDAQGTLDIVRIGPIINASAVGFGQISNDSHVTGVAVPVKNGDRIYLNYQGTSASTDCYAKVYLST
jgi:hypothetical protein